MKSSKRIGDVNEIKKTFFFHTHECFARLIDLFCLLIYVGGIRIYGVHVVIGTFIEFSRFPRFIHFVECLYAEARKPKVLGTSNFFLSCIDSGIRIFSNLKPRFNRGFFNTMTSRQSMNYYR